MKHQKRRNAIHYTVFGDYASDISEGNRFFFMTEKEVMNETGWDTDQLALYRRNGSVLYAKAGRHIYYPSYQFDGRVSRQKIREAISYTGVSSNRPGMNFLCTILMEDCVGVLGSSEAKPNVALLHTEVCLNNIKKRIEVLMSEYKSKRIGELISQFNYAIVIKNFQMAGSVISDLGNLGYETNELRQTLDFEKQKFAEEVKETSTV